jgi:hypothetical protein
MDLRKRRINIEDHIKTYHEQLLVLEYYLIDQMLHYKYNYQVTKYDGMVNEYHVYLHIRIYSKKDFHQTIFVQYVH